jgi:hypothetical protein
MFLFLFSRQVIDAFKTINCNFEIYNNEIGKLNEQIKIIKLQLIEKNSEKYFLGLLNKIFNTIFAFKLYTLSILF